MVSYQLTRLDYVLDTFAAACARTWTKIITNHYFLTNRYFKVLSSGTSESDLLIRESLLISKITLVLNANIRSTMK